VTLPDVHLAGEAVAAYVDDALSPIARDRAERHLRSCTECRAVVEAQREAKVLLAASFDPELPAGLLARLRDIPMTADLGGSDIVLAIDCGQLTWARRPVRPDQRGEVRLAAGAAGAAAATRAAAGVAVPVTPGSVASGSVASGSVASGRVTAGPVTSGRVTSGPVTAGPVTSGRVTAGLASGWHPFGAALGRVSAGIAGSRPQPGGRREAAERGSRRPESYPPAARWARRRSRRLAGALAGLAFGVIASAASTTAPGTALPDQRVGGSSGDSTQLVVDRGSVSGQPLNAGTLTVRVPGQRRAAVLEGVR
jgi:hypothetical protein